MAAISEARQKCIDACLKGMKLQHAVSKYKVDVPRDAKSPAYRQLDRLIAKLKREKIFVQVAGRSSPVGETRPQYQRATLKDCKHVVTPACSGFGAGAKTRVGCIKSAEEVSMRPWGPYYAGTCPRPGFWPHL